MQIFSHLLVFYLLPLLFVGQITDNMAKYSRTMLRKIEEIYQELSFKIRYEKGNFQSGYCIVDEKDIIVINKFFDTDGRAQVLVEILDKLDIQPDGLSEENANTLLKVRKTASREGLFANVDTD